MVNLRSALGFPFNDRILIRSNKRIDWGKYAQPPVFPMKLLKNLPQATEIAVRDANRASIPGISEQAAGHPTLYLGGALYGINDRKGLPCQTPADTVIGPWGERISLYWSTPGLIAVNSPPEIQLQSTLQTASPSLGKFTASTIEGSMLGPSGAIFTSRKRHLFPESSTAN